MLVGAPPRTAVAVRGVAKSFDLPHERATTVRERLAHPLGSRVERFQALRHVDLDIRAGETFAVVGRNGGGKSTLLRCIAGIHPPDEGTVEVRGRIASFIELGFGFEPELAARDNAILTAVMFGLSRREAARRFDDILAFAELEQFVDQRLKNLSSGMVLRLAFAVAVHVDADVLLFDEVLTVGDAAFQAKCRARLEELRDDGRTIVLVAHDMEMVRSFCDRAALLHRGEVVATGDAASVAAEYEAVNAGGAVFPRVVPAPARASRPRAAPRVLPREPRRVLAIVGALAAADFKLKYAGASLNYAWAVARPLALFGVLVLVFTSLGPFDAGVRHYPLYVLTGVMLWTFFLQATSVAVGSLVHQAPFLRTVPLPHLAIPLAVVAGALLDLAVNLVLVFAAILLAGVAPAVAWLELVPIVALIAALTTGVSLALAAAYLRLRDVDQIWLVVGQAAFYLTPVFYVVGALPRDLERAAVLLNPLATALTEARHALVDPAAPSAAAVAGGAPLLLVPVALCGAALASGLWLFARVSPRAAEIV